MSILVGTLVGMVRVVSLGATTYMFLEGVIGWIPSDPLLSSVVVWGYWLKDKASFK